jgi:hypothetical protein
MKTVIMTYKLPQLFDSKTPYRIQINRHETLRDSLIVHFYRTSKHSYNRILRYMDTHNYGVDKRYSAYGQVYGVHYTGETLSV